MKKAMHQLTFTLGFVFLSFCLLYFYYNQEWMKVCAISFGTTFYHFMIRLMIGSITFFTKKVNYEVESGWFKTTALELKIYQLIRVKQWKDKMPTYSPESFSLKHHTFDEIIHNMCDSEIVHELNVLASYLPLMLVFEFKTFNVFFVTSFLASLFDLSFVMIQRYNRPRVIELNKKRKKGKIPNNTK